MDNKLENIKDEIELTEEESHIISEETENYDEEMTIFNFAINIIKDLKYDDRYDVKMEGLILLFQTLDSYLREFPESVENVSGNIIARLDSNIDSASIQDFYTSVLPLFYSHETISQIFQFTRLIDQSLEVSEDSALKMSFESGLKFSVELESEVPDELFYIFTLTESESGEEERFRFDYYSDYDKLVVFYITMLGLYLIYSSSELLSKLPKRMTKYYDILYKVDPSDGLVA